jgi:hypothetical protein
VADVDDAAAQIDVLDAKSLQLAAAETGIHRRRPQRSVVVQGREEARGFGRCGDAVATATYRWELQPARRVDRDLASGDCTPVDGAQRHERVADRRRLPPLTELVLDKVLQIDASQAIDAGCTERWEESESQ